MRYKKRERETKRIRVPLSCSDSNLWTRGWRTSTLLLPRCRARPFARCRHHPPERWSRALFSSSFSPKEEDGFCASNDANAFCACTPVILVASKRIIRNNSEDETTEEERHRSSVRRPPRVRRRYPLSPEQHACVIFEGVSSKREKRFCCVLFLTLG